jgi:eukaryotic-like serine/threonine-protein kinase
MSSPRPTPGDGELVRCGAPCTNLDLTLGRSSVVLMAALLLAQADIQWPATLRLARYGDDLCAGIWREAADASLPYYGIAHGWAGIAYATMVWSRARGVAPPPHLRDVLDMLGALAEPSECGVRWPLGPGSGEFWPGWCHGNVGYVFLWNMAEATFGGGKYAKWADRAAWLIDGPVALMRVARSQPRGFPTPERPSAFTAGDSR